MRLLFRPIDEWPAPFTKSRRTPRFSATWNDTLEILERELVNLGASEAVIQVDADERAMRMDGGLRADAKVGHPGVIISFETKKHGPMRYFTDVFSGGSWRSKYMPGWQMNARAIALGLEALRKIERYGISERGEAYSGWKQLGAGIEMPAAQMTAEEAAAFLIANGEWGGEFADPDALLCSIEAGDKEVVTAYYREAAKRLHPDAGGSTEEFQKLQEAKRILDQLG